MTLDLTKLSNTEFDWRQTLSIHQDNEALATELCHMLVNQLPEFEQNMRNYYQEKKWVMLKKEVHRLRGGLCYVVAPKLADILQQFEEFLAANAIFDPETSPEISSEISPEVNQTITYFFQLTTDSMNKLSKILVK